MAVTGVNWRPAGPTQLPPQGERIQRVLVVCHWIPPLPRVIRRVPYRLWEPNAGREKGGEVTGVAIRDRALWGPALAQYPSYDPHTPLLGDRSARAGISARLACALHSHVSRLGFSGSDAARWRNAARWRTSSCARSIWSADMRSLGADSMPHGGRVRTLRRAV